MIMQRNDAQMRGRNTMIIFRRKRARDYRHPYKRYALYAAGGAYALLLLALLITLSAKNAANRTLEECRDVMAASIQENMNQALRSFDEINRRSADLQGEILPSMKQRLYAADAMNRAMVETFGEQYSVYDLSQYENFAAIMAKFDELLATGQSTDEAKLTLASYMTQVEELVSERFGPNGLLLPKTAKQSTEP